MPAILVPTAVAVAAGNELPRIFDDALNTLREGEAQYLKSGEPTSLPGKISQAAGRSACRIYNTGNIDLSDSATEKYERACRPYLDDIYPPSAPTIGLPFRGGQCAVDYLCVYKFNNILTNGQTQEPATQQSVTLLGPIGIIYGTELPEWQNIRCLFDGGQETFLNTGSCDPRGCYRNIEWVSITRSDGLPDDCGSVPPVVVQPDPNPDPNPPPFIFNPSTDIDIDVDVDVDVDGRITFNIGTGPITIDPFGGGGGGDDGGGGDGGGGGGGPSDGPIGDPGTPGTPVETDEDGEAEEEAPPDSILVGLLIDILESPPGANEFKPGVFRGAAYIYMGTPGALDQDLGGSMIRSGQFFFAEKDNLTVWEVNANIGFRLRVTPYYREVEG